MLCRCCKYAALLLNRAVTAEPSETSPRSVLNKIQPLLGGQLIRVFAGAHLQVSLLRLRRSFFDQRCNLLRPGDIDDVARAFDFDFAAFGARGIPPFEIGVDGSVFCRNQHPARLASPCRLGDDCIEIGSSVEHLRSRHKGSLLRWQVGRKVLMKLRRVEVSETVSRLLYGGGPAEVAWESLPSSASHSPASGMWAAM